MAAAARPDCCLAGHGRWCAGRRGRNQAPLPRLTRQVRGAPALNSAHPAHQAAPAQQHQGPAAACASAGPHSTHAAGAAAPLPRAGSTLSLDKQLSKLTKQTATTFAPRASGAVKNPAIKGSTLYQVRARPAGRSDRLGPAHARCTRRHAARQLASHGAAPLAAQVFEVQAWAALLVGGLLSFNLLLPSESPDIPRLLGMWSIWMFTIPSLRARECAPAEKDALNTLFLLVPLLNVGLPFVWKSFGFIFAADVAALVGVYAAKGVWAEVYGLPLGAPAPAPAPAAAAASSSSSSEQQTQQEE